MNQGISQPEFKFKINKKFKFKPPNGQKNLN
jgi:hypothetical protein